MPRSRPRRKLGFATLALASFSAALLLVTPPHAAAQNLSPEAALARIILPPDLKANVFAAEPDIRQPVAAAFDARGRLWVVEYLQYPNPAGLKPVAVDQYLRTKYDRVPEPPPKGPRGADRIKILEDTDHDGRADKITTFIEGLNLASAIAIGYDGVFIGQAPYLLYYPDRDRDDRPDGDPEVLLEGFGLEDAHATMNSLAWGPDGWLYGAQGSTVTAQIRGVGFQQGIWRYHVPTKRFELFAEGGGNTWGLDFDRHGNAFGSSNGAFVAFHMVQGGYYWKGFAKHGPLHNPRTYGYFNSLEFHGRKPGGHVSPGGILYEGALLPDRYSGALISGNLLANTVYSYRLEPKGSSFELRHDGTLIDSRDPWFRPVDLLSGPDGALYVVDWHDERASHLDPRDNWDRTNGRIFRITSRSGSPKDPLVDPIVQKGPYDLDRMSTPGLIALLGAKNHWWRRSALRVLIERKDPQSEPRLRARIREAKDPDDALWAFWAWAAIGLSPETTTEWLTDKRPEIVRWTVRLLGDSFPIDSGLAARLIALARSTESPAVRSQIASTCQRISARHAIPILEALAARGDDERDPQIPLLLWWGFERAMREEPGEAAAAVTRLLNDHPIARDTLAERMARALVSNATEASLSLATILFSSARNPAARDRVLYGIEEGLVGTKVLEGTARMRHVLGDKLNEAPPLERRRRLRILARLGDDAAYTEIAEGAAAPGPASDRQPNLEILGQLQKPAGSATLLGIATRTSEDPALRAQALAALGSYADPSTLDPLIAMYGSLDEQLRARLVEQAISRPSWTARLLEAMAAGTIPTQAVSSIQAERIAQTAPRSLAARLEQVWGQVPTARPEAKAHRIAEIRGILPEGDKGNSQRGVPIFEKQCAGCHVLFGKGERIGPELTGSERLNLEFLLESVIDPSHTIRKEFQAESIALEDGRVLAGLVVEENDRILVLFDSQQQKTTVPKREISERKASTTSVMPDGILDNLPDNDIRDLFRYLQSQAP
jgi:putative membrane-bound dehydrogenase-like protein